MGGSPIDRRAPPGNARGPVIDDGTIWNPWVLTTPLMLLTPNKFS